MAKPTFNAIITGKANNRPGPEGAVYQALTTVKSGKKTTIAPPAPKK